MKRRLIQKKNVISNATGIVTVLDIPTIRKGYVAYLEMKFVVVVLLEIVRSPGAIGAKTSPKRSG